MIPAASVLIRTKNEAASIAKTLRLVSQQHFSQHEIVVVDSGSTDGTLEILRTWKNVRLITLRPKEFSYGRALNIGCEAAQAKLIVPLSAHAYPRDAHWLARLVQSFDDSRVAGIYGRQLPHKNAWPLVRGDYMRCFGPLPRVQANSDNIADCFFSSANAAIRRAAWRQAPFDEDLPYAEDQQWAKTVLQLGYTICYDPAAAVYHSHNESLLKVYKRTCMEYEAFKRIYGTRWNARDAWRYWWNAIRQDYRFIRNEREPLLWAFRSPGYRLARALGMVTPSLPGSLLPRLFQHSSACRKQAGHA